MLNSELSDISIFSGKVRVRTCGLLEDDKKILLIKHDSIGSAGYLWAPPGGGVEFGDSLEETLKKEFKEETGLSVKVVELLFVYEFIGDKHHAIEFFYRVEKQSGTLKLGSDPELDVKNQIMSDIKFISFQEIEAMDERVLHGIFREVNSPPEVFDLKGLFSFRY